ncbi:hypothetical protein HDE_11918 [Halotydeus destructor]|nr:hypothetical protein HDE_11918 [Halotydeus destructor]
MLPASSVTGSTRATWLVTIAPVTPPPVGQDTNPTGLRLPVTPKEEKGAQLDKEKAILCSHIFCPNPFSAKLVTKYQPTTRCTCDCPHGDHHCLKIKRGTARLSPTEAQCVRRLDCMEPECTFPGAFDKTSGRCPRSADHGKLKHHQNRFRHQKHYLHERD